MARLPKQSDFKELHRQVVIPASERYANDFTKKAKKIASDEKETKKKISTKSGDLHMIQKTPMVKIREEYQDLEYESDDEED